MKCSKSTIVVFCLFVLGFSSVSAQHASASGRLRAPAYPLITIDPYTSAWSFTDRLYDDDVRHWTGQRHTLTGAIRVDGRTYRFMGRAAPPLKMVVPPASEDKWSGRYTFDEPAEGWNRPVFDDSQWQEGEAAFGTEGMPFLRTGWNTNDIWVRREVKLGKSLAGEDLYLEYSHDDIFELYFNGVKVVGTGYTWRNNVRIPLPEAARKTIGSGPNVIAAHCHNRTGGGYVDFGLYEEVRGDDHFDRTAVQQSVSVTPTQTLYTFTCGPVTLDLTFTSPLLADNLALMSRPVNYITYTVASRDGKDHKAEIYFEASPEWAVHTPAQKVTVDKFEAEGLTFLKTGTKEQNVLGRKGDDVRIDWGYFYMAGETAEATDVIINETGALRKTFAGKGTPPKDAYKPSRKQEQMPGLAFIHALGRVDSKGVSGKLMLGYDDRYAVQYFGKNLQAWWKEDGKHDIVYAFRQAHKEYEQVMNQCRAFDEQMVSEATKAGGPKYAELCALAYRQAIAAHKLVRNEHDEILFFSKENFSNGSIGTVDVTYPSAPLFLCYNPDLLKGMLNPIFYYTESGKWTKPFAAHDVGTYPVANGQTYGGDMPVEECGNMLILTAAIAEVEGKADYARKHWNTLTAWANYLRKKGFDPANQLCTDDFAGHLARNANLSIKAILGLACYGKLAGMLGDAGMEHEYYAMAREMAGKWRELAYDDDHFTLAFEKQDTWSQKYNLVWDEMLNLYVFIAAIAEKEVRYYLTKQNKFGLPLDSRKTYTKSDWIVWTATLSPDQNTFRQFIDPLYNYVNTTPDRVPLSDWHETTDGTVAGFRARSVVGGYFMKILSDRLIKKQSGH